MSRPDTAGCWNCANWLRGTESNPRSPFGSCLGETGRSGLDNIPEETRFDDWCANYLAAEAAMKGET